ncbi:MAG: hypothetical protein SGI87_14080, partial [Flavobacteriales bacterium]|nr:hypothetical protein [Flavobacteriales bacterium]
LSGEWQDMDYRGIVDYMSGRRTVVRAEGDWHLHNPHVERNVQMTAEGNYSNLSQEFHAINDEDVIPSPLSSSPDFEL